MQLQDLIILFIVLVLTILGGGVVHAASGAGMTKVYKRILKCKKEAGLTWDEIAEKAGIPLRSWMTGIPTSSPTNDELKKIAPVLNTTYDYLKYGK